MVNHFIFLIHRLHWAELISHMTHWHTFSGVGKLCHGDNSRNGEYRGEKLLQSRAHIQTLGDGRSFIFDWSFPLSAQIGHRYFVY